MYNLDHKSWKILQCVITTEETAFEPDFLVHAGSQVHRNSTPLYFKFFFFSGITSLHLTNLFRFKVSQAFPCEVEDKPSSLPTPSNL